MNTPSGTPQSKSSLSGRSPEEIENEIEGTREELSRTLDALQAKLSPRRRLNAAADSARRTGESLMRTAADTMTPDITTMIRMDHSYVQALFRRFRPRVSEGRKKALVTSACLALDVHTQLEEEIFYPALEEVAGPSEVLDKSVPEHDEMRTLIKALRLMEPAEVGYDETFRKLMGLVLHHVADEESILLPQAEELMGDELGALGMEMTRRRMELLKPHLSEIAVTTARSFPVAVASAVAGVVALGWLALRPRKSVH